MENGLSLKERYGHLFGELTRLSRTADIVNETNVYQEANPGTRKIMDGMLKENLLSGSRLEGKEHFFEFYQAIKAGKRALILPEHYSNLDLPVLCYLLEHDGSEAGREIAQKLVAIAGMKLNEQNPMVKAWAEGFTRIVIFPSRGLSNASPEEQIRGKKINMAAMRALDTAKRRGQPVLMFPSGTRYRPGRPETKQGVREIDSYLRTFDVMILVSINGCCLRLTENEPGNMLADQVYRDKIIIAASPVMDCRAFRLSVLDSIAGDTTIDPKQAIAGKIMALLEAQHSHYETVRSTSAP
ncbi:MAG: 1-acyl-sn-glycerol-3-phosphate acyltransferase [Treponema sp.]|jgi:glycerol-3-phosphate O-acyltransferase|nr:1-acyl-sn-glycerol-3-phosphate acyltransferase [Treponema sp.]